jgi:2-isopropylmalate synthase
MEAFRAEYIQQTSPFAIRGYKEDASETGERLVVRLGYGAVEHQLAAAGNGPIDAFIHGVNRQFELDARILDYEEHAVGSGADAVAVAYVEMRVGEAQSTFGVGMHANIVTASLHAIASALNRAIRLHPGALPKTLAQQEISS